MALNSLDVVKNRVRQHSMKALEAFATENTSLPKAVREKSSKPYEIEVIDEDCEQEMVKIHYKGYDSKFDEWKPKNEVVLCPPSSQAQLSSSSPFETLACAIKKVTNQ